MNGPQSTNGNVNSDYVQYIEPLESDHYVVCSAG